MPCLAPTGPAGEPGPWSLAVRSRRCHPPARDREFAEKSSLADMTCSPPGVPSLFDVRLSITHQAIDESGSFGASAGR